MILTLCGGIHMNSEPRQPIVAAYVQVSGTKGKWNPTDYLRVPHKQIEKEIVGACQHGND
jgi:hypothetical protein